MLLALKNIGKIADARIELNGITVIAGENNTGKSTLGKVLFCIFNSFYKIDQQIYNERKDAIGRILEVVYRNPVNQVAKGFEIDVIENIIKKKNEYVHNKELLKQDIEELYLQGDENIEKYIDDAFLSTISDRVIQILNISDEEVFKTVLQKKLESEFNGQINNIYSLDEYGEIHLQIKDSKVKILVKNDNVNQIVNSFSLNTEVIYIDDPFALDDLGYYFSLWRNKYTAHREHLKSILALKNTELNVKDAFQEIIATKKLDNIYEKIDTVCSGQMVKIGRGMFGYKRDNLDAVLNIKNISTGLKTFIILKTLLLNGSLEENGTIVLDEPEIHLHPEWQLIFAELIVLIQKEFGMHILLNTHSPYFLNAVEVYAAKYEIADKCRYYLAENSESKSVIIDVSTDVEKIYEKLARPLQDLENERYSND